MTTSFEAANDAFLAELRSHGAVVSDVIAVADYTAEHAGRGIVANADIAPETELFSLPLSACLSATTSRAAAWIPDHPELAENGWAPVITAVLYELAFRESSQWNAYFDILPASLETPLFWPESDLALLVGTDVPKRIAREESLSLYTNVILPAIEHHVADPADRARFSPDLFLYAGSLLMAYGFSVGSLTGTGHDSDDDDEEEDDMPILVPLADTLNAVHPNSAHLQRSGDTVAMVATAAVAAGTQVFNTYGDHACNELLRRYGYVEWEKRFDAVTVDAEAVVRIARAAIVGAGGWGEGMSETKVDAGIEKRIDHLADLDVYDDEYEVTRTRPVPADLILTIKFLLLAPDAYKLAKRDPTTVFPALSAYTSAAPDEHVRGAPIHLTPAESRVLGEIIHDRLAAYPAWPLGDGALVEIRSASQSIAEYLEKAVPLITSTTTPVRAAYAALVREAEREILRGITDRIAAAPTVARDSAADGNQWEMLAEAMIVIVEEEDAGRTADASAATKKKRGGSAGADADRKAKKARSKK